MNEAFCFAFALAVTVALAQDSRGTILGRVTDSTDALIPDAEVVALNAATGVRVTLAQMRTEISPFLI
jgi:hypothetical protein